MATSHNTGTNPSLPDDIIYLILSRLPVKSLLRFKTACRSWLSLISSRDFIKTHLSMSTNDPHYTHHHLLVRHWTSRHGRCDYTTCSVWSLINEPFTKNMLNESGAQTFKLHNPAGKISYIVGCCNGLICLAIDYVFLWNPSTRKSRRLPKFDKLKFGKTKLGFCYDESCDDFKVFAIFDCRNGFNYKAAVYSLKSDFWRMIGDFCVGGLPYDGGMFANGAMHWVVIRCNPVESIILSVNIQTETLREVMLPNHEGGLGTVLLIKLDTFGENLIILIEYKNIRSEFWELEKYGVEEGWRKLFTIPHYDNGTLTTRMPMHQYPKPVCIFEDGDVLLNWHSTIVVYNTKHNTYKDLLTFGSDTRQVCTYVESLVSPHL